MFNIRWHELLEGIKQIEFSSTNGELLQICDKYVRHGQQYPSFYMFMTKKKSFFRQMN